MPKGFSVAKVLIPVVFNAIDESGHGKLSESEIEKAGLSNSVYDKDMTIDDMTPEHVSVFYGRNPNKLSSESPEGVIKRAEAQEMALQEINEYETNIKNTRSKAIKHIMEEYGVDEENAEKMLEDIVSSRQNFGSVVNTTERLGSDLFRDSNPE